MMDERLQRSLSIARLDEQPHVIAGHDFFQLRSDALAVIQERVDLDTGWTDFNIHDPGVTILEACLWSLVDLLYRTESHGLGTGVVDIDRPPSLPGSVPSAELSRLLGLGLDRHHEILEIVSRRLELGPIDEGRWDVAVPADTLEDQIAGVNALMRELASPEPAPPSDEGASTPDDDEEDAGDLTDFVAVLVTRARAERLNVVVEERWGELAAIVNRRLSVEETVRVAGELLGEHAGFDPEEREILVSLARFNDLPFPPETLEHPDGNTRVWPPHPHQLLACEPVTPDDYRSVVAALGEQAGGLEHVWIVPGAACGLRYDGKTNTVEHTERQGALTIVLEPSGIEHRDTVTCAERTEPYRALLEMCLRLLLPDPGGATRAYWSHLDVADDTYVRRLMCDELYVAVVGTVRVDVAVQVVMAADQEPREMHHRLERVLEGYISSSAIGHEPDRATGATTAREDDANRGWRPGAPLRISDLARCLRDVRGVEVVGAVQARIAGGDWRRDEVPLPPYTVPVMGAHSFSLDIGSEGGRCG